MIPFVAIIPARYAATRLPGKPLLALVGKPMIQHVYERAQEAGAEQVWIATDDGRIVAAAERFGAQTWLTRDDHRSGTERLSEVATRAELPDDTIVVNVQGDEPLIPPALIRQTAQALAEVREAQVATVCHPVDETALTNPNIVKVVRDHHHFALYFSRAPIPWQRDENRSRATPILRHIGLYAYRAEFLRQVPQFPPSSLEQDESLEQLRWLHHGARILVPEAQTLPGPGVDTPEDVARVEAQLQPTV